jgi:hypothetical protein
MWQMMANGGYTKHQIIATAFHTAQAQGPGNEETVKDLLAYMDKTHHYMTTHGFRAAWKGM